MGNNYKLSFSELILEKGKWEIKQSVLKISNIEDFLRFFTIFSNYDLSKLGFTNFNNSNIFLKNITKDRKLKEEIELFLTEERFLQLLKNDEVLNYVKDSEITEENFLKFLYELKKNHIKTSEKLLFLKNFLNLKNNDFFDLYHKICKKEEIFEMNILFNDIIEDKFTYVLAIIRGKLQKLIFEKIKNQETQKLGDENFMERENVLEIEIKKVNNKYSAFWVTKKDKSILGMKRQALKSEITGIIHYLSSSYEDRYSCEYEISSYDNSSCYKSHLSLSNNNDEKPYIFESEYESKLKELVDIVNKNFGKPIRWRGKVGKNYFRIVSDRIIEVTENNTEENDSDYRVGNYFKDEIEARKVLNKTEFNNFWEKVKKETLSKIEKEKEEAL